MRNKKSLLSYVAIPIFGLSILSSCNFNNNTNYNPRQYEIGLSDENGDGLKDVVIRDSKGKVKDIYLKQKDGNYFSLKEIKLYNMLERKYSEDKKKDDDNNSDDDWLFIPGLSPFF